MSTFKYPQVKNWCVLVVAKTFKALLAYAALTPEEQEEMQHDLEELGNQFVNSNYLTRTARHHGLNLNWLLYQEVPQNLPEIHDNIRKLGYLQSRNPVKDVVKG